MCLSVLQWGRDREVADSCFAAYSGSSLARLQWGRDREVADRSRLRSCRARHRCFNGAATARSRIATRARCESPDSPCFNGAATARSRIAVPPRATRTRPTCFNGAATARSRIAKQSSLRSAAHSGFNGAATARSRIAALRSAVRSVLRALQWGRDREVADRRSCMSAGTLGLSLQWGRDREVADRVASSPSYWPSPGRQMRAADI